MTGFYFTDALGHVTRDRAVTRRVVYFGGAYHYVTRIYGQTGTAAFRGF